MSVQKYIAGEDIHFEYSGKDIVIDESRIRVPNHDMTVQVKLNKPNEEYPTSRVIKQGANGNVEIHQVSEDDEFANYKNRAYNSHHSHSHSHAHGYDFGQCEEEDEEFDSEYDFSNDCEMCNHSEGNEEEEDEEDEGEYEDEHSENYETCTCPHHKSEDKRPRKRNHRLSQSSLKKLFQKIVRKHLQSPPIGNFLWNFEYPDDIPGMIHFWIHSSYDKKREIANVNFEEVINLINSDQRTNCNCRLCGDRKIIYDQTMLKQYKTFFQFRMEALEDFDECDLNISLINSILGIIEEEKIQQQQDDNCETDIDIDNTDNKGELVNGLISVADDLVKNNGENFIDLIEKLDTTASIDHEQLESDKPNKPNELNKSLTSINDVAENEESEKYDDYEYESCSSDHEFDNPFDRLEEVYKLIQIFYSKILRTRVHDAFQAKRAEDISKSLLDEEERTEKMKKEKEEKERKKREKAKEKKRLQKLAKEEERKKQEQQKEEEERILREEQLRKTEEGRKRKEAEKKKKEELERKKQEEKKRRKEAELERQRKEKEEKDKKKLELKKKREEETIKKKEEKEKKDRKRMEERKKELDQNASKNSIQDDSMVKNNDEYFESIDNSKSIAKLLAELDKDITSIGPENNFTKPNSASSVSNLNDSFNSVTNYSHNMTPQNNFDGGISKLNTNNGLFNTSPFHNSGNIPNTNTNNGLFNSVLFDSRSLSNGSLPGGTSEGSIWYNSNNIPPHTPTDNSIWNSGSTSFRNSSIPWGNQGVGMDTKNTSVIEIIQTKTFEYISKSPNNMNIYPIKLLYQFVQPLLLLAIPNLTLEQYSSALSFKLDSKLQFHFEIFKNEQNEELIKLISNIKPDNSNQNIGFNNKLLNTLDMNNLSTMNNTGNLGGINGMTNITGIGSMNGINNMNGLNDMNALNNMNMVNTNLNMNLPGLNGMNMNNLNSANRFSDFGAMNNLNNNLNNSNDFNFLNGMNNMNSLNLGNPGITEINMSNPSGLVPDLTMAMNDLNLNLNSFYSPNNSKSNPNIITNINSTIKNTEGSSSQISQTNLNQNQNQSQNFNPNQPEPSTSNNLV